MTLHQLLEVIEQKRTELFAVVSENGISSNNAIECSQQLDKLINIYLSIQLKQAKGQQPSAQYS